MSAPSQRVRRAAAVLVAGLALSALPQPAHADGDSLLVDVPGDGRGFVNGSSTPLFDFSALEPGDTRSAAVRLWNHTDQDVSLGLQVGNLVDGENGCLEPESNEGADATCGTGEGELSRWLEITVDRMDGESRMPLWTGPVSRLVDAENALAASMPAGARWDLGVQVELLPTAGDDTMTDAVTFALEWMSRGQDVSGEAQVLGVEAFRSGGGSAGASAGVTLPFTGVTVEPWLLWFAGTLVGGGALLMVRSRRLGASWA